MKELLGDRIKHYRERANLSQRALAALAKMDAQTIYRLENGRNWLDYDTLTRLASTLKVDERALFADPDLVPKPTDKELLKMLEERLIARLEPPAPQLDNVPPEVLDALRKVRTKNWDGVLALLRGLAGSDAPHPTKDKR